MASASVTRAGPSRTSVSAWRRAAAAATDLLFPPHCACCGEGFELQAGTPLLCPECSEGLNVSRGLMCDRCACVCSEADLVAGCGVRCRDEKLRFTAARTIGPYEGMLRQALLKS